MYVEKENQLSQQLQRRVAVTWTDGVGHIYKLAKYNIDRHMIKLRATT